KNTALQAEVESACHKAGHSLSEEQSAEEPQASRLKENLPLITLIVMMAISWGLEQFNHPFGQLAFIATTLVGLYPIARQALRLIKSGSRSEEHTSELQSRFDLVCRLLLEKKHSL